MLFIVRCDRCVRATAPVRSTFMFGNKRNKAQKAHAKKLKEAVAAQRAGKIQLYAKLIAEAEALLKQDVEKTAAE